MRFAETEEEYLKPFGNDEQDHNPPAKIRRGCVVLVLEWR